MYPLPQQYHRTAPCCTSFREGRRASDDTAIHMGHPQKRRKFASTMRSTIDVAMVMFTVYFMKGDALSRCGRSWSRSFLEVPLHPPFDAAYSRYRFFTLARDTTILSVSIR